MTAICTLHPTRGTVPCRRQMLCRQRFSTRRFRRRLTNCCPRLRTVLLPRLPSTSCRQLLTAIPALLLSPLSRFCLRPRTSVPALLLSTPWLRPSTILRRRPLIFCPQPRILPLLHPRLALLAPYCPQQRIPPTNAKGRTRSCRTTQFRKRRKSLRCHQRMRSTGDLLRLLSSKLQEAHFFFVLVVYIACFFCHFAQVHIPAFP